MFPSISPKQSFPALESEVLAYWKANNTFQKSIDSRPEDNPYRFYDGPPFITGTPHYGSLLSSIVKDVVGRYWTMRGKRVDRVWWWDCHGLPIEEKVQKKLGLSSNREIEERGVKEFIDGCYEYTASTSAEWTWYIDKIGRWVDMDRAYRTMDQDYMESVMWVFKRLWDQWLIYEGKRVSLYSWKLGTPISNFEVAMDDTYQEVNDPAITVKFDLSPNGKEWENTFILAWTTTPWTIPANMALAVREDITYVEVRLTADIQDWKKEPWYIVAKNRVEQVFKGKWDYEIMEEISWEALVGMAYIPPFPEYYHGKNGEKNHRIYHADFITDTDGTGIGHEAPEFGDVDFQLAKREGIFISEAMDEAGKYTSQIFDYEWLHYQEANKVNIERMKENGTLFKSESITHRVPFCPRSGTPLVQKAQKSWFIDIQSQKEKLLKANEQINWFPEHLKYWRFAKGIESAPDWCISRTRYWWAPMPVWQNKDASERVVISSREEIFEMNKPYGQLEKREMEGEMKYFFTWGEFDGVEFNLHKPYIDSILLAPQSSQNTKKVLWVHGWTSRGIQSWYDGTFLPLQDLLKESEIQFDVPDFDKNKETSYVKWRETLETLDIPSYDAILATSFGCAVIMQYLCEKKIKIPRLILVAPSGLIWNEYLEKIIPEMTENKKNLKKYVTEIIVIHSKDDDSTSAKFEYGKTLSEEIWGYFIPTNGFKHKFGNWSVPLLAGLIKFWAPLIRIPEVLDVWMDSGSMPYAQMHYPFENKWEMEASFPADFIAEYVGQVRAWFYVMHVLGVLLNLPHPSPLLKERELGTDSPSLKEKGSGDEVPRPAFTNVITTGVINGNDGRKMSKSYGNYPDPRATIEKYGADPIRFYMLNSPLLSWGDMDFKEEQIIETVKGVMLPLWNTYSFFTTYANIDKWTPDDTEIHFLRHAETPNNAHGKVNGGGTDSDITETGKEQAKSRGADFRMNGKKFDVIVTTPLKRTRQTAEIIVHEIGFDGIWEEVADFAEQDMGSYEGRTHAEIEAEWKEKTGSSEGWFEAYRNNETEPYAKFAERVLVSLEDIRKKYKGKKILIVAHGGTGRVIRGHMLGMDMRQNMLDQGARLANCETFPIISVPLVNDLDRWILSKLQVLLGQVHDAMDSYDVSRACRAIVDYMDHLTNWYVRLSRRRFWESGMTVDKDSAYSTLHTVLVEVSKLLAPYMPFLAESVFQGLTKRESVHLEYVTFPNRHLIANDLNRDMEQCEHIVSLGLALRSQKNIRVRQPLQSVTITAELDEYYKNIIRDELNVKEVKLENPEKLAKKIAKPDAKKIGPKYGKDVQSIIMAAKNGEFTELEDGKLKVWNFILEAEEYTLEYLPLEWVWDVIGGYGMVVAMDTSITDDLKLEWYARDIIRQIQDMRKEGDYQVTDRIKLSITGEGSEDILTKFVDMIEGETLSTLADITDPDVSQDIDIEGKILSLRIKKA
jgi:isoleucyl-tRNA synthetase/bisphosphoglycerate-dependent phosphoglycerate mutase